MQFNLISDWNTKKNVCAICGTTKSVKYIKDRKTVCNRCVLKEIKKV